MAVVEEDGGDVTETSENVLIGQGCGRKAWSHEPGHRSSPQRWQACTHISDTTSALASVSRTARTPSLSSSPSLPPPPLPLPLPLPLLTKACDARLVQGQRPCLPMTMTTAPKLPPEAEEDPEPDLDLKEAPATVIAVGDGRDEKDDETNIGDDGLLQLPPTPPPPPPPPPSPPPAPSLSSFSFPPASAPSSESTAAAAAAVAVSSLTPADRRACRTRHALPISPNPRQRPPCLRDEKE